MPFEGRPERGAPSLSIKKQLNNESIPEPQKPGKSSFSQIRKSACTLAWNVEYMCEKFGIENIGFLTLTFADHVLDRKEAQRRFHSLAVNVLKKRYSGYVRVMERQKSGRIHYHLLVVCNDDIQTGLTWKDLLIKKYSSANKALRGEWAFWRKTAKNYGFGRTELLPIRSTSEGISKYVGKYIGKHFDARQDDDKGARLVSYSGVARMATCKHTLLTKGSAAWRRKCQLFAEMVGHSKRLTTPPTINTIWHYLGKDWAYKHREFIISLPDPGAAGSLAGGERPPVPAVRA